MGCSWNEKIQEKSRPAAAAELLHSDVLRTHARAAIGDDRIQITSAEDRTHKILKDYSSHA